MSFVSDDDFIRCVERVCYAYPDASKTTDVYLQRHGADPFKLVFDVMKYSIDLPKWRELENSRQADKTVNNTIGEFHQNLLGCVDGWRNLETGDPTKLDLKKEDGSVFIELKNKFNTVNSDSLSRVWEKLEANLKSYPNSVNYWAHIIPKNTSSGESDFVHAGKSNPMIRKIWGKNVYALVTGKPDALESVWRALPNVINEVEKTDRDLPDLRRIEKDWFEKAF